MPKSTHLRLVADSAERPVRPLRIAFASSNNRAVDQHFGTTGSFVVYELGADYLQQVALCKFQTAEQDGDHGKLVDRIVAIEDCDAVYANAIGNSAVRQLIKLEVQPLRVAAGVEISVLIRSLQQQLKEHPPQWMQKAQAETSTSRFDLMEAEGWQE